MYCVRDYRTKKAMREAVKDLGVRVMTCQPGPFPAKTDGEASIEGPHYPKPHTWYARVKLVDGEIVKVLG